ncbi:MAG: ABC transporter substrate-binding protein [Magnetovibrionaceae bacterium]
MATDLEVTRIRAGILPLVDAAPLVVAAREGFARAEGLELEISVETSWSALRDKVSVGLLDCAAMLAPMPLAASLGAAHFKVPTIVPMSLSLNGNAITVSNALFEEMLEADPRAASGGPFDRARAVAAAARARSASGREPVTFAMVFPFSAHNLELRHWLKKGGARPDEDIRLIVIPPPMVAESLKAGLIDGYCVGEPWNQLAVSQGYGRVVVTKAELWPNGPEKVLGVPAAWAEQHPHSLSALLRALAQAARWADAKENQTRLAGLMADPSILGISSNLIEYILGAGSSTFDRPNRPTFHAEHAIFPWRSHAAWFLSQMKLWGQIDKSTNVRATAEAVYRPDLLRSALGPKAALPESDWRVEGEGRHDFFGDETFDPLGTA